MGRLLGCESTRSTRTASRYAREAAERSGCVVLLKGDDTIVARPAGRSRSARARRPRSPRPAPATCWPGIIGALLSKGMDALEAAAAGVRAHVDAGPWRRPSGWARTTSSAGDVIEAICPRASPRRGDSVGSRHGCARARGHGSRPGDGHEDTRRRRGRAACSARTTCPACRSWTRAATCVGIVTESDLVITDDDGEDLHLPHYIELFGRPDPARAAEEVRGPAEKAAAATVARHDDRARRDRRAGRPGPQGRSPDRRERPQPPAGGGARPAGRRRHARRRARARSPPTRRGRGAGAGADRPRRDRAQLRAPARLARRRRRAVRGRQGRRLRPRRAAERAGGARRRRELARGGHGAARPPTLRGRGIDVPPARDGRAHERRPRRSPSTPARDVVAWTPEFVDAAAHAPPEPGCT